MIKLLPTKMQDFSQIRFQMSRNGILLSICSARLGVSILPEHIANMLKDNIRSIKIEDLWNELGIRCHLEKG